MSHVVGGGGRVLQECYVTKGVINWNVISCYMEGGETIFSDKGQITKARTKDALPNSVPKFNYATYLSSESCMLIGQLD